MKKSVTLEKTIIKQLKDFVKFKRFVNTASEELGISRGCLSRILKDGTCNSVTEDKLKSFFKQNSQV